MNRTNLTILLVLLAPSLLSPSANATVMLTSIHNYAVEWDGNTDRYPGPIATGPDGSVYTTPRSLGSSYWLTLDNRLDLVSQVSNAYSGGMWGLSVLNNGDILGSYAPLHGYNYPSVIAGPHQVLFLNPQYEVVDSFGGHYGSDSHSLHNPTGISGDSEGNVYVADTSNNRVVKLDSNLNYLGETSLNNASAIVVHGNYVYASSYDGTLLVLNLDLTDTGRGGPHTLAYGVQGLAVDSDGRIWAGVGLGIEMVTPDLMDKSILRSDVLGLTGYIGGIALDAGNDLFVSAANGVTEFSVNETPEPMPLLLVFSGLLARMIIQSLRASQARVAWVKCSPRSLGKLYRVPWDDAARRAG